VNVLILFEPYSDIAQVNELSIAVCALRAQLAVQIVDDFKAAVMRIGGGRRGGGGRNGGLLSERHRLGQSTADTGVAAVGHVSMCVRVGAQCAR
jgi:hypothetical protein